MATKAEVPESPLRFTVMSHPSGLTSPVPLALQLRGILEMREKLPALPADYRWIPRVDVEPDAHGPDDSRRCLSIRVTYFAVKNHRTAMSPQVAAVVGAEDWRAMKSALDALGATPGKPCALVVDTGDPVRLHEDVVREEARSGFVIVVTPAEYHRIVKDCQVPIGAEYQLWMEAALRDARGETQRG
jgi:hypothetical protein